MLSCCCTVTSVKMLIALLAMPSHEGITALTCLATGTTADISGLCAEMSRHVPLAHTAPPLFKQPPKKRQKLTSQPNDSRPRFHHSSQDKLPHTASDTKHALLSAVKTEASSGNSPDCDRSPGHSSDMASEPASSAVAKDTPGSSASWQPAPQGGHDTPPLLYPTSSGQGQHTSLPPQAMDCDTGLQSGSKSSSNAVTPTVPDSRGVQPQPTSEPPSGASTAEHSVINAAVAPSPFDPSDSIKRQLLAAVGGNLDVTSLEGLVKPLFASPPGGSPEDLHNLLFAAQHQASGQQSHPAQPDTHADQSTDNAADAEHNFSAEGSTKAEACGSHLAVPPLKLQPNPIAKPHAMPRTIEAKPSTTASTDHLQEQDGDPAPLANPQSQQSELHRAASAHMAAMLQIPFSGVSRMPLWQPPPLKLDSPPLTLSPHSPLTSLPPVITPVTLSSIGNLTQQQFQLLLPTAATAKAAVMVSPHALQHAHESQTDGPVLDLESLMKAVRAEGAALYAAAIALDRDRPGGPSVLVHLGPSCVLQPRLCKLGCHSIQLTLMAHAYMQQVPCHKCSCSTASNCFM